jgi:hypothetical protein
MNANSVEVEMIDVGNPSSPASNPAPAPEPATEPALAPASASTPPAQLIAEAEQADVKETPAAVSEAREKAKKEQEDLKRFFDTARYGLRRNQKEAEAKFEEQANKYAERTNQNGRTALSLAAEGGHLKLVGTLLDKNANVNAKDRKGEDPLRWAVWGKHVNVAELLASKGNVNNQSNSGETALMSAVFQEEEMVKMLLRTGANATLRDDAKYNALMYVAERSRACPDIQAGKKCARIADLLLKDELEDPKSETKKPNDPKSKPHGPKVGSSKKIFSLLEVKEDDLKIEDIAVGDTRKILLLYREKANELQEISSAQTKEQTQNSERNVMAIQQKIEEVLGPPAQ